MAFCKCPHCDGLGIRMGRGGPTERYECPDCKGTGIRGICRYGFPLSFIAIAAVGAFLLFPN